MTAISSVGALDGVNDLPDHVLLISSELDVTAGSETKTSIPSTNQPALADTITNAAFPISVGTGIQTVVPSPDGGPDVPDTQFAARCVCQGRSSLQACVETSPILKWCVLAEMVQRVLTNPYGETEVEDA